MLETVQSNGIDRESSDKRKTRESTNTEFLELVGSRIKKIRKEKKITRKLLSEQSGVSERYLALLESGKGNVSIALLRQVAQSLDVEPEILVSNSAPINGESRLLLGLLAGLTSNDRLRFKDQLLRELRNSPANRSYRIALIGLRGAGKTTVGERLSIILNIPFVEIDREIEKLVDAPLSEIFITYGQEGYRNLEKTCLENVLSNGDNCIISTGGSIVQEQSAYDLLLSTCYTVWLKASPKEHMDRVVAQGDLRPIAGNSKAMEQLKEILIKRQSSYEKADVTVATDGKDPHIIASQILADRTLRKLIQHTN
ncbi:MAG: helix-turn-helix transcriptional regulator [Burkholderiales bacterium]|jgi:XRE family transcriptional regulator, aerobic/anaerobic benzoate catabolism transcriptional regulator|nr:helix-turn-helix transcriptional regulator [Burkholderiales bacterium]